MERREQDDSVSQKNYFKEIRKFDQLDADKQIELAVAAQNGDDAARDLLIKCNQRFIVSVVKEYKTDGLQFGDLVNEANIGMIRAIDKFDPSKNIKFLSYAVWWIRQAITSSIYDNGETVRLPVNKIAAQNKLNKAREALIQELNREPTLDEMIDKACLTENEIVSSSPDVNKSVSLDSKVSDDSEFSLIDFIQNDSHDQMENAINRESLATEINSIFQQLTEREATILSMYYGLNGQESKTLREIGQVLDLTNERVRQIKELAKRKLRSHSKSSRLKEYLNAQVG